MSEFFSGGLLQNLLALLAAAFSIIGTTLFFYRKFVVKENLKEIGATFRETVEGLSSNSSEVRMMSAILLRRFFDEHSELGTGDAPFADDAVQVISALLKTQQTCNFQKVLADSLLYAPSACLKDVDLQKANLSKACLSLNGRHIDMKGADFFQANLSGASLKGAILDGAIFYESILVRTALKNASLRNANFSSAILQGVDFFGADLTGACFDGALLREVNFNGAKLDGARFDNARGYAINNCPPQLLIQQEPRAAVRKVFVSKPGLLDVRQEQFVSAVREIIGANGFEPEELHRDDYDVSNVLTRLSDKVDRCGAMVVFGFKSIHVQEGVYRYSTEDMRQVRHEFLSTPWCQLEIGLAAMKRIPVLLLIDDDVHDGVFDRTIIDDLLVKLDVSQCLNANNSNVLSWLKSISVNSVQNSL